MKTILFKNKKEYSGKYVIKKYYELEEINLDFDIIMNSERISEVYKNFEEL